MLCEVLKFGRTTNIQYKNSILYFHPSTFPELVDLDAKNNQDSKSERESLYNEYIKHLIRKKGF
jgi:hypothetical protein